MTRHFIPVVVDEYLWLTDQIDKDSPAIIVGSNDWYAWLADEQHTSFAFKEVCGNFTARHERQRNGWYWYAYRKRNGRIHKIYLGRPAEMNMEMLKHAASVLAAKVGLSGKSVPQQYTAIQVHVEHGHRARIVLDGKFTLPTMAVKPVERPRLFTYLTSGVRGKLTLISAPAGWGKTTLLGSWCSSDHTPGWPYGWITLDPQDNEIQTFWVNILTALNRLHPGIARQSLTLLRNAEEETIHLVIKTLLNACHQLETDTLIIIDNYQAIQKMEIHSALSFFLDHLPSRLHLIISSRTMPPLPLARLRVQGTLTEIRNHQLRFTTDEADTFFKKIAGVALDASECTALTASTEGWIAGLQLASLSMRDKQKVDPYLNHNRYIRDYLIEEVIQQQTAEIQQFMLQTSTIERFSAALCDTIRQANDSQERIEQLENANLCQLVTDQSENWYSYAPLLREALCYLLQRSDAQQFQQIQQRAGYWYDKKGQRTPAHYHTMLATGMHLSRSSQPANQTIPEQHLILENFGDTEQQIHTIPVGKHETTWITAESASAHSGPEQEPGALQEPLTRREQQVLRQILNGASNRDIAHALIISEGTVKKHVFNICSKLGVQSRSQAMAKSIALSLL